MGRVIAKAKFWLHHQNTELNERQRKALNRLLDAGAEGFEGGINTRKYASLNKTSRATAYRELADRNVWLWSGRGGGRGMAGVMREK